MNKRIPVLLVTMFLAQSCLKSLAQSVPTKMNYQGVIANSSGIPLPTGNYNLTFRIYNAATGPTLIWGPQTIPVAVVSGQFNVALGPLDAATPTPRALSAGFASATSYLEIQVGANPPIVPRQQILSAPFAFEADHAATLGGSSGTPLITSSGNSVTVAGSVAASSFQGAFAGNGSGLTGLTAGQIPSLDATKITSGTLGASQIPNLDAGKITTGTIDARLSANVALLNRTPQTFTGINTFVGAGSAFPATSGSIPSAGLVARFKDATALTLDIGGNAASGHWLQSTHIAALNQTYPLMLNPNGGNVLIGTTTPNTLNPFGTPNLQVEGILQAGGPSAGGHFIMGGNQIQQYSSATTPAAMYLNFNGGIVYAGQKPVTVGEENLRIVRGTVAANGSILKGAGFTVTKGAGGIYTINFSVSFFDTPTVTVTPTETNPFYTLTTQSLTPSQFGLFCHQLGCCNPDIPFGFIAIGPR